MGRFRITPHFRAPIDTVFAVAVDPLRMPVWVPSVFEVRDVTSGPMTLGSRYTAATKVLGRLVDIRYEVTELDAPRLLAAVGTAPHGGRVLFRIRLSDAAPGTDGEVEVEYALPAGFAGHVGDPSFVEQAMERDMRHGVENFRALVEAEAPIPD